MITKASVSTRAIIAAALDNPQYDGLSVAELSRTIKVSETGIRRLIKDGQARSWWYNRKRVKPKAAPREFVPISADEYEKMQDVPEMQSYRQDVVNFW